MSEIPARLVVMGVTGSGKTTVGALLAGRLDAAFLDGDDYHPPANVEKMRAGTPLADADRWPWLDRLAMAMEDAVARRGRAVVACSALRRVYRERIAQATENPVLFVHLTGPRALIHDRMAARREHYMPTALLDSQIATLEPPEPDETALGIAIDAPAEQVADRVLAALAAR